MLTSNKPHNSGLCGILHAHVPQYPGGGQHVSGGPQKYMARPPRHPPGVGAPPATKGHRQGMPGLRSSLSCAAPSGRKPNTEQDSPAPALDPEEKGAYSTHSGRSVPPPRSTELSEFLQALHPHRTRASLCGCQLQLQNIPISASGSDPSDEFSSRLSQAQKPLLHLLPQPLPSGAARMPLMALLNMLFIAARWRAADRKAAAVNSTLRRSWTYEYNGE